MRDLIFVFGRIGIGRVIDPGEGVDLRERIKTAREEYGPHQLLQVDTCLYKSNAGLMLVTLLVESDSAANELLGRPTKSLNLSARITSNLELAGILTIGQLVAMSENELLNTKNFGIRSLVEIKQALALLGISLRCKLCNKPHTGSPGEYLPCPLGG